MIRAGAPVLLDVRDLRATVNGLQQLMSTEDYAARKGVEPSTAQQKRHEVVEKKAKPAAAKPTGRK